MASKVKINVILMVTECMVDSKICKKDKFLKCNDLKCLFYANRTVSSPLLFYHVDGFLLFYSPALIPSHLEHPNLFKLQKMVPSLCGLHYLDCNSCQLGNMFVLLF